MEADTAGRNLYHFLVSAVAPRPIAWVTTQDEAGVVNAAPFSWFQAVCAEPPILMLSISQRPDGRPKDTLRNIQATGEFVVNAAPLALVDAVVQSSADYPEHVSEVEALALRTAPSAAVTPPRLADSPVHLECRLERTIHFGPEDPQGERRRGTTAVFGHVVHVAADDAVLDERGNIDPHKLALAARMGGPWYTSTKGFFAKARPAATRPKGS